MSASAIAPDVMSDLLDPRSLVRAIVQQRRGPKFLLCGFCGAPCFGRTCPGHRDLIALDPNTSDAARRVVGPGTGAVKEAAA
jgi:hypothetical protein